jgi:hypothetical protein
MIDVRERLRAGANPYPRAPKMIEFPPFQRTRARSLRQLCLWFDSSEMRARSALHLYKYCIFDIATGRTDQQGERGGFIPPPMAGH